MNKNNSNFEEKNTDLKELLNKNENNLKKTNKFEIKINKNFKNIKSNYSPNSPKLRGSSTVHN